LTPAADERDRIRVAMQRILDGVPQRSNGALTVVALALEADVPRNALTQRHPDLKNEFYELVAERDATPEIETQLRATIAKLKRTIANKNRELIQFKTDFPALLRAVNQLTLENQQLREALANPHGTVVPFPRTNRGDRC
jgi:septal ring factor EnvC (AmiA/AmiB activator)